MFVLPDAALSEILIAIEGDTNIFPAGFVMRLFTNDFTPDNQSVIGDFTELTNVEVPGYAAVAIVWDGTPIRSQLGQWDDFATDAPFAMTGAPPGDQAVYGWYMTDAANTALVASGRLAAPFTFHAVGDGLRLEPRLSIIEQTGTDYLLQADVEQS